jgi:hypothetical protein
MLKRVFLLVALWALLITLVPPQAAESQESQPSVGAYKAVGGGGMVLCGRFVSELDKGPQADLILTTTVIAWVQGYLTAYNATLSKSPEVGGDLAKGMTDLEVFYWIIDYCSAHRDDIIASAASEVTMYLFRLASRGDATH